MYLQKISLENYRSFHKAEIKLSKITLLLGPNSGGKTSVFSALLSVLQSEKFPNYLSLNGSLAETGDYREVVSSHDNKRNISVGVELVYGKAASPKAYTAVGTYARDPETSMPVLQSARVDSEEIQWTATKFRSRYKVAWTYRGEKDSTNEMRKDHPELMAALEKMLLTASTNIEKSTPKKKVSVSARKGISEPVGQGAYEAELSSITNSEEMTENIWAGVSMAGSLKPIESFRKRFAYIGSHRFAAQRTYYHMVGSDLSVGVCGQNAVEQILSWKNTKSKNLVDLGVVMRRLGLASSITTNRLAGGRFEVRLNVPGSKVSSSLADVGFGVNQILPVLVAELQLPKGGTVAVSQPETHLHPKIQAEITSHFVEQVRTRDFRYIVETHSEYIINRLRRLIRKGDLSPDDVAVYYVEPSHSGASMYQVYFEKTGKISGAPKGFFDTYQIDVMNIAFQR